MRGFLLPIFILQTKKSRPVTMKSGRDAVKTKTNLTTAFLAMNIKMILL